MNQTENSLLQSEIVWIRRHNGQWWPGKPLDADAVTRYPNVVAEIGASGMWLWCPAEHANVSPEVLAAALEDNEELSFLEVRGLARLYGCTIAYLTAPELAVVDPTANKGKRRRRISLHTPYTVRQSTSCLTLLITLLIGNGGNSTSPALPEGGRDDEYRISETPVYGML